MINEIVPGFYFIVLEGMLVTVFVIGLKVFVTLVSCSHT